MRMKPSVLNRPLKRPNSVVRCLNVSQPPTPCPLSDNEPGQCLQSLSNQPGKLPASNSPPSPSLSPSLPNLPMSIHWRRNVVVVSSNLPNSPFPTARFRIRSHWHGSLCPKMSPPISFPSSSRYVSSWQAPQTRLTIRLNTSLRVPLGYWCSGLIHCH